MQRAFVIRGHINTLDRVDLDEPVADELRGEVEVTVRPLREAEKAKGKDILEVLGSLKGGNRTKEDIDAQIAETRSWGDR